MQSRTDQQTGTGMAAAFPAGAALVIAVSSLVIGVGGGEAIWISTDLPLGAAWHFLVAFGFLLPLWALGARWGLPRPPRIVRVAGSIVLTILAVESARDVYGYYRLLASGAIRSDLPVPLSLGVLALLVWAFGRLRRTAPTERSTVVGMAGIGFFAASGAIAMLLAVLITFGSTDYRRKADCAVVLGAGVFDDGRPSLALSDRVREGVHLYREGRVERIIMTGGTGRNGHSEPQAMRRVAVEAGVPAEAILLDEHGITTRHSAENVGPLMRRHGLTTALIVSHYYHLARCRGEFARAGVRCRTVPATMSRRLAREPYYVLRECAGFLYSLLL